MSMNGGNRGETRSSALWGTGNRGGESRSNALWGKGGRGALTALAAMLAISVPLASSAGDQTPPGSETLTAWRTVHGIVYARGTVGGKPVAFVRSRSTYWPVLRSRRT